MQVSRERTDVQKKDGTAFMVFICRLLINTVRISNYIPSNYRVINEGKTEKSKKGSGRGLL